MPHSSHRQQTKYYPAFQQVIMMPPAGLEHPSLPLKTDLGAGLANCLKEVHVCGTGHIIPEQEPVSHLHPYIQVMTPDPPGTSTQFL